ncbi:MAG: c-type cytochrome [Bacteroidetes bacterium]|nr:MAG: c-type cytochrome [Bacteroidota bacterium]TNF00542.1 MAG: c-type cytochrome [Bacteroidota bacterium]
MKISNSQMFRINVKWCIGLIAAFALTASPMSIAQGDALFKAKCATCHQVFKDGTGPKLYEVRKKWEAGGAEPEAIFQWVKNWQVAVAKYDYAKSVESWSPSAMSTFPDLTDDQITSIFDWIDSQVEGGDAAGGATAQTTAVEGVEEESNLTWVWVIMAIIFVTIVLAIGGVRRQLKAAAADADGESFDPGMSYGEEFKQWAWKNRKYVGLAGLVIVICVVVTLFLGLYTIGVVEDYQPSQPIAFPHATHAGINGIDCKYCHNSVTKSRSAGLPTVNVCMNCHKQINGRTPEQQEKIAAIYEAAGWNPEGAGKYTGDTKPIVWNKVHVLPDHVYFSHKQHVVVGNVDCKQCHGDMTKMVETAKVQPVEELNKVDGNIKLTKATLTMGWCIECHKEKEVSLGALDTKKDGYYDEIHKRLMNNDKKLYEKYLEDGKVTVSELGGWECAKCHY